MRKLMVANRKGGVGKSTTAVHLAAGLARVGLRVLLVDSDGQGSCSLMLGVQPEAGLAEMLLGEATAAEAIVEARPGLHLLSGSRMLAQAARLIARREYDSQYVLRDALVPLESGYDMVVLDTPPGYDSLSINVYFFATEILAPINMEALSARGFVELLHELRPITERSGIEVRYILPTMADRRKALTAEIIEQLQGQFGGTVCEPIRYAARMSELSLRGRTIYEEDDAARPALDYAELTKRVLSDGT